MSRSDTPLEDYAAELRWLERCRRWALPVAGMIGAVILLAFMWALSAITGALL